MKTCWIYLFVISLSILGCKSIFSTRKPEPPITSQSSWIPPLNPGQVLVNLKNAISERNVENYIRCIVNPSFSKKTFHFSPDPKVAADYPELFKNWNRDKEEAVIKQAFSLVPTDSISFLDFTEGIKEIVTSDSAVFVRRYRLELHHTQSNLPRVYEGQAEFWLAPDQRGEWSIYQWIDNGLVKSSSWSFLKAALGG